MSEVLNDRDDVGAWLAEHVYCPTSDGGVDRVGLELELFPYWLTREGRPAARLALVEIVAGVEEVPGAQRRRDAGDGRPAWDLGGALITEEPGAQLEVAGPPDPDVDTAVERLEGIVDELGAAFEQEGAGLAAAGLDLWSGDRDVPVQLEVPRYEAMSEYFRRRDDLAGFRLMCSTCSLQINLDLGAPATARRRWVLANLAAPVFTAAFAASPTRDGVNGRALGWRGTDQTRTGVPAPLVAGDDDPLEHVLADVLRADVMFIARGDEVHPGEPGWRFADWVRNGHERYGPPTGDDLALHLTTLWPEARLRGSYIEVRTIDSVPRRWRSAVTALVVGLLYDDRATDTALDRLSPFRAELPETIDRAARQGLNDLTLRRLAAEVLQAGHEGAVRLGMGAAERATDLLEAFTLRGRHLSDELEEASAGGPGSSFAWAEARS
jgi:glutamate--cysteine ligase